MSAVRLDAAGAEKILLAPSGRLWEDLAVLGLALVRVLAAATLGLGGWAAGAVAGRIGQWRSS